MKIAIVENELAHCDYLQNLLQLWSEEHRTIMDVGVFESAEEFLSSMVDAYHLVFLDIQMDGIDGVTAAHQLRDRGFRGELVFLTAFSEYVFQGYDVRAFNYLLKPPSLAQITTCLDYVSGKLHEERYTFRYRGSVLQVPYSKILYFSSANHYTQIVTTEEVYKQMEPMRNIHTYLPSQFLFCHRTVIINIDHVVMLRGRDLILSNEDTIPVGQKYLPDIRSALLSYAESMR